MDGLAADVILRGLGGARAWAHCGAWTDIRCRGFPTSLGRAVDPCGPRGRSLRTVRAVGPRRGYIQRRLIASVSAANPTGATPAIQSQWTYLPKSGFIVALAMIDTPTTTAAQKREDFQLLGLALPAAVMGASWRLIQPVTSLPFRCSIAFQYLVFGSCCSPRDRLALYPLQMGSPEGADPLW